MLFQINTNIFYLLNVNKEERIEIRKRIFLHLDGWALIPSIFALHKLNILSHFIEKHKWRLSNLSTITKTNEGYLNVALRILASQGYLERKTNNFLGAISNKNGCASCIFFIMSFTLYGCVIVLVHF